LLKYLHHATLAASYYGRITLVTGDCVSLPPCTASYEFGALRFPEIVSSVLSTYCLTPWSRVLLEKLTSPQLIMKTSVLYGTLCFVTVFTCAR